MTQQLTDVARSRFKLLERPFAHPGKCAVCGAVNREVIDFDLNLDEYGAVYFCVQCLTQVAHDNLDMVSASELRATQSIVDELEHKLNISTKATNDYVSGIRALHSNYVRVLNRLPNLSDAESSTGAEDLHGERIEDERGEIRDPVSVEQTPDGSISSEGPVSVPANSSNGPFAFI